MTGYITAQQAPYTIFGNYKRDPSRDFHFPVHPYPRVPTIAIEGNRLWAARGNFNQAGDQTWIQLEVFDISGTGVPSRVTAKDGRLTRIGNNSDGLAIKNDVLYLSNSGTTQALEYVSVSGNPPYTIPAYVISH